MQVSPEATGRGVYRNIAIALRARIIDGEFAAGSRFPSESALSEQYKVARNTLRRALDLLAAEGLLVAQTRARTHCPRRWRDATQLGTYISRHCC